MRKLICFAAVSLSFLTASASQTLKITVTNPLNTVRTDQPVVIPLANYGEVRSALVTVNGQEIPCQLDDLNQDEVFDELCFLADLGKKEQKQYTVELFDTGEPRTYPARVYAEMLLRNISDKKLKKNQQNNFIESITARGDATDAYHMQHHHGVDFESEEATGTAGHSVLHRCRTEGTGLWRRRAVGGSDLRTRGIPWMGRHETYPRRTRTLAHPAHHQLRPPPHHRRSG